MTNNLSDTAPSWRQGITCRSVTATVIKFWAPGLEMETGTLPSESTDQSPSPLSNHEKSTKTT